MLISPAEVTYKQNLVLRLLLLLPVLLAWVMAGILYADASKIEPVSAIIAVLTTLVCGWGWVSIGKAELSLHAEGVRKQTVFGTSELRWDEITQTLFQQTTTSQMAGAHLGLLGILIAGLSKKGKAASMTLTLRSAEGRKLVISSNWQNAEDLVRKVLTRVDARLKAEFRKRIQQGETVLFGKIGLSQSGVSWKNKTPIPFTSVAKAYIGGSNFRLKGEGKWLDTISVNTKSVPNVFVLIDLIEELKAGGKGMDTDPILRARGVSA